MAPPIRKSRVFRRLAPADAQTLVGAAMIAVLVLGLWLVSVGGKAARSGDEMVLTARFDQVDGLTVSSAVYLAGIRVGAVQRIALDPGSLKPLVTISVARRVAVPADSALTVMSDGLLGGKYLRIEPGADETPLKSGAAFEYVQSAVVLEQILEKIVVGAEARRKAAQPNR